jgi:hypothetical protein
MPWRQVPMKDVVHCDKLRGVVCKPLDPEISEWGNPPGESQVQPVVEHIAGREPGN